MSKEEILKIQTCVLKVNIHCDGCENKVRKILQKTEGVYKTSINSEQGKVTVSGNIDPTTLIKKLAKSGKHAELWGTPKPNLNQLNNNNNNTNNNNIKIDGGKGANNKNQKGNTNNNNNNNNNSNQQKGGQNQQVQKMKGFQDLKLPQFKGLKMPFGKDQNKKVKFEDEDDGMTDDEFDEDDYDDDDEFDDDYMDDDMGDAPHQAKGKPMIGNGQMANMMAMLNGQTKGVNGGGTNNNGNGKKGGGANVPAKGNDGKNGKKGGGNVAQNQGGKGGKTGGGGNPFDGKNSGGGAQNKNGNNNNNNNNNNGSGNVNGNGGKKVNDGVQGMSGYHHAMGGGKMGQIGNNNPMGQMGPMGNFPMGQVPAVQGLPAGAMAGGGGGYYGPAGPEVMAGSNPYYQQQMMMNQQRAQGNERFQPMMYARPPPAVNYMPPYYPYPPPADPFTHAFSDENTSSCNVM